MGGICWLRVPWGQLEVLILSLYVHYAFVLRGKKPQLTWYYQKHTGPSRGKPQESKAARIPQNELLDLIYDCFKRYTYWPLKSLKAELNQPEAYLKQTLELVAHLVRQGPHAMTWQLKPESKLGVDAGLELDGKVIDGAAPDIMGGFDGASDLKEEEFEDVLPSDEEDVEPIK